MNDKNLPSSTIICKVTRQLPLPRLRALFEGTTNAIDLTRDAGATIVVLAHDALDSPT
jgi:hypothetical protein